MNSSWWLQLFLSLPAKELWSQVEQDRHWCCAVESIKCHRTCSNCFAATSQLLMPESQNYCSFLASWNETLFANITPCFSWELWTFFSFVLTGTQQELGNAPCPTQQHVASALTFVKLKVLIHFICNLLEWTCRVAVFSLEEQQLRSQILSFKRFSRVQGFYWFLLFIGLGFSSALCRLCSVTEDGIRTL